MAITRSFNTKFWSDPDIVDNYTPEDKYFYLYLLLNERTTLCGTFTASVKTMSNELGYSCDSVLSLIERHYKIHKTIMYDRDSSEILILKWCKYNWTTSENLLKSVVKQLKDVNSIEHKNLISELVNKVLEGYPIDTLSIPYRYHSISISNSISNSNIDNSTNTDIVIKKPIVKKKIKEPKPPTSYEEVLEYAKENKRETDAERFWKFFEAGEWYDSKGNPVLNWKQKFQTWGMYGKENTKEKANELKDLWNKKEKENGSK